MAIPLKFSPIIVGAMRFGAWGAKLSHGEIDRLVKSCLDMGLRDFDHADIYGGYTEEENFGKLFVEEPSLRDKVQLTTKCGIKMMCPLKPEYRVQSYDSSANHIKESVENSLRAFRTDRIDLLLIHRPDLLMVFDEIAEVIQSLKDNGKILHFGVSNFTTTQIWGMQKFIPIENHQLEFSLTHHEPLWDGSFDVMNMNEIQPTAWSPIGGGAFFDKKETEQIKRIKKEATGLLDKYNCSMDQLLMSWIMTHPSGIIPITGTTKISRIKTALEATKIKLEKEDWYALLEASRGHRVA